MYTSASTAHFFSSGVSNSCNAHNVHACDEESHSSSKDKRTLQHTSMLLHVTHTCMRSVHVDSSCSSTAVQGSIQRPIRSKGLRESEGYISSPTCTSAAIDVMQMQTMHMFVCLETLEFDWLSRGVAACSKGVFAKLLNTSLFENTKPSY